MMGGLNLAFLASVAPGLVLQQSCENARIDFGKHKGELMVELPDSYLTWISKRRKGRYASWAPIADKILDERHAQLPDSSNKLEATLSLTATDIQMPETETGFGSVTPDDDTPGGILLSENAAMPETETGFGSVTPDDDTPGGIFLSENAAMPEDDITEEVLPREKNGAASESSGNGSLHRGLEVEKEEGEETISFSSMKLEFLREDVEDSIIFDSREAVENPQGQAGLNTIETEETREPVEAEKKTEQKQTIEPPVATTNAGTKSAPPVATTNAGTKSAPVENFFEKVQEYRWFKREPEPEAAVNSNNTRGFSGVPQRPSNLRLESLVASFERHEDSNFQYGEFIRWCGDARAFEDGKFIHAHIMNSSKRHEKYVLNFLVEMYGKWGDFEQARQVFEGIQTKNVFSWNSMLDAYVQNGRARQAVEIFQRMDLEGFKPNKLTFFSVIQACTRGLFLTEVKLLHRRMVECGFGSDGFLITCLINFYGRCGRVEEAMAAFREAPEKDSVTWTTGISALARNKLYDQAFQLYEEMKGIGMEPSVQTLTTVMEACAGQRNLARGRVLHAEAGRLETDTILGTSLVHMYGKCGDLDSASSAFRKITRKDIISWNTIISAFLENHLPGEALKLFEQIPQALKPNGGLMASALEACVQTRAPVSFVRWIHQRVSGCRLENDAAVANALVQAYVSCGDVSEAARVFQRIWIPNEAAFAAIVRGISRSGDAREALRLLRRMQLDGFAPDYETFMNAVFVCGQRGMLDEGVEQLLVMSFDHGVATLKEDYGALGDLFARSK